MGRPLQIKFGPPRARKTAWTEMFHNPSRRGARLHEACSTNDAVKGTDAVYLHQIGGDGGMSLATWPVRRLLCIYLRSTM